MGNKGNNRHVKRLAANRYVNVSRKTNAYLAKPNAGRHNSGSSISLITIVKEKLNFANNSHEARMIIKSGELQINGKTVKEEKYPLGFGDILKFNKINKSYKVEVGHRGIIVLKELEGKDSEKLLFKVVGKYVSKGNKKMIRLHDGSTFACDKPVSVNDSITLKSGKVEDIIKLEKGAKCLVIKGIHSSEHGIVKEIKPGSATRNATVEIERKEGATETLLDNIIVTGAK